MVYTEIKKKGDKTYYYRVKSVRKDGKISKERKYLGVNLSGRELKDLESKADKDLEKLSHLLTREEIKFLEKIRKACAGQPKETWENRYESFVSKFTYDSNAIEGNTLTLQETSQLLFDKVVPASKSMREVNEALNHKEAFDYILKNKEDITKEFILKLHEIVMKQTLKPELASQAGKYRTMQVFIRGVEWIPAKPSEVSKEMKSLLAWYSRAKKSLHPLIVAAYFHVGFETVHPFVDGNGRVGRLLMNFILHKNKYPMINIPNAIKHQYYSALHSAQVKGDLRPFVELLLDALKENKVIL
jgi:Fic family protein